MKSLEFGSLLHDIGKIGVPDAILRKPAKLTDDEWVRMREHPLHDLVDWTIGLLVNLIQESWKHFIACPKMIGTSCVGDRLCASLIRLNGSRSGLK